VLPAAHSFIEVSAKIMTKEKGLLILGGMTKIQVLKATPIE